MDDLIRIFSERGDLAHCALFLWTSSASALAWFALRELIASMRRFDDFVRELARFNGTLDHKGEKLDTLHSVILKGETRPRRDHLTVFREFISQLDRIGKRQGKAGRSKQTLDTKIIRLKQASIARLARAMAI